MKKILITTDLSDSSKKAFSVGKEFAQAFNAEILLLAIIEDPSQAALAYAFEFTVLPSLDVLEQVKLKVQAELQSIEQNEFGGFRIKSAVREAVGPPHLEIVNFAKENNVDLIVMATHGRGGFSRMFLGSVTEKVLHQAPCPVVTIPTHN